MILLGFAITGSTAVSLAAVATDKTVGGGGAYAIIVRSFGIEAGGVVGIPLYLSQTLVIAPYLFGFRDGWLRIFPDHPALLVDLVAFAAIVGIAVVSARFSFRMQYLILALIGVAVASMALGAFSGGPGRAPVWWGRFSGAVETGLAGPTSGACSRSSSRNDGHHGGREHVRRAGGPATCYPSRHATGGGGQPGRVHRRGRVAGVAGRGQRAPPRCGRDRRDRLRRGRAA
ncbi:MAG: hypothetical protein KY460_16560 [Actinobacteria bacterium]|nr:hypothetical protein [Actinomycetota bacterium]